MERRIEAPPRRGTTGIIIARRRLLIPGLPGLPQYSVALAGNNLNPLMAIQAIQRQ